MPIIKVALTKTCFGFYALAIYIAGLIIWQIAIEHKNE